jgi:tetratricopeptide (TPR) repeat protein
MYVNTTYAQFEEDIFDDYVEEVQCKPESLQTVYDVRYAGELDKDIRLVYNFGYEYYKNKSYDEALPYLWQVYLKNEGKYGRAAVRKLVNIYYTKQQVDSTLIVCYRGLERYPEMATLHHYAGILQVKLGKPTCAINHYEKLVKYDSTNVSYLQKLAELYFQTDKRK